jgi:S1-C subfamily serine protease
MGSRLEHPMVARIRLAGYATKEIQMTDGPMNWISVNGRNPGEYWLLKSDHFQVTLQPISQVFTGGVAAKLPGAGSVDLQPELSLEVLVRKTKPAVVYLKGLDKSGTGFFVTETGVIATNAHVARGEESLLTILPGGERLEAKVLYIDADLDIALAKVEGKDFPHLGLADAATVRQGENVLAFGNPGTWIQTDTPIHPGNSGGPLLNDRGEVIGIHTQKLVKKNVTGMGFALSATELLEVLHRFYANVSATHPLENAGSAAAHVPPAAATVSSASDNGSETRTPVASSSETQPVSSSSSSATQTASVSSEPFAGPTPHGFGTVTITADPDGAEIFIDDKFAGSTPAKLKLAAGSHVMVIRSAGLAESRRTVEILKDSQVTRKPVLEHAP